MAKPKVLRDTYNQIDGKDTYFIRLSDGTDYVKPHLRGTGYRQGFSTRAAANNFIKNGGLIDVTVIPLDQALTEAGWDDDLGYGSEVNTARVRNWCETNGVHWFSAEKEDCFEWRAIEQAQKLGLSKVVIENLS